MTRNTPSPAFWITTLIGAALIYVLPLVTMWVDTQSSTKTLYALVPLLVTNPIITVVVVFITVRSSGAWAFLALGLIAAVFLASVFLVYNSSALIYLLFIAGAALLGWLLAVLTRRKPAPAAPAAPTALT